MSDRIVKKPLKKCRFDGEFIFEDGLWHLIMGVDAKPAPAGGNILECADRSGKRRWLHWDTNVEEIQRG